MIWDIVYSILVGRGRAWLYSRSRSILRGQRTKHSSKKNYVHDCV